MQTPSLQVATQGDQLYAVRECSDVFADAALRNSDGELMFLSLFGRDTAILQFFASFSLPVTRGGRNGFTLVRGVEEHRIAVTRSDTLEKLTGRLPRGNLFGNLTHVWLYQADTLQADRVNRSALLLRFKETDEAFNERLWQWIRELCPVPLLEHWRAPLLEAFGEQLVSPLASSAAPPIGVVDGARLALPADFEWWIAAGVAERALTLEAQDMPVESAARWRAVVRGWQSASAEPKFALGRVVHTQGVAELLESGVVRLDPLLARHERGDWGVSSDGALNDAAVKDGGRVLSAYPIDSSLPCKGFGENTIWIITEWDRSVTTCLLPEEY